MQENQQNQAEAADSLTGGLLWPDGHDCFSGLESEGGSPVLSSFVTGVSATESDEAACDPGSSMNVTLPGGMVVSVWTEEDPLSTAFWTTERIAAARECELLVNDPEEIALFVCHGGWPDGRSAQACALASEVECSQVLALSHYLELFVEQV